MAYTEGWPYYYIHLFFRGGGSLRELVYKEMGVAYTRGILQRPSTASRLAMCVVSYIYESMKHGNYQREVKLKRSVSYTRLSDRKVLTQLIKTSLNMCFGSHGIGFRCVTSI